MSAYSRIQWCTYANTAPTIRTRVNGDYVGVEMRLDDASITLNFTADQYRELARACEAAATVIEAQQVAA